MPFKFSDVKVSLSNIYRNEENGIPEYSLALIYETQGSRVLNIFLFFHRKSTHKILFTKSEKKQSHFRNI